MLIKQLHGLCLNFVEILKTMWKSSNVSHFFVRCWWWHWLWYSPCSWRSKAGLYSEEQRKIRHFILV